MEPSQLTGMECQSRYIVAPCWAWCQEKDLLFTWVWRDSGRGRRYFGHKPRKGILSRLGVISLEFEGLYTDTQLVAIIYVRMGNLLVNKLCKLEEPITYLFFLKPAVSGVRKGNRYFAKKKKRLSCRSCNNRKCCRSVCFYLHWLAHCIVRK
jgi:hypothetical protein